MANWPNLHSRCPVFSACLQRSKQTKKICKWQIVSLLKSVVILVISTIAGWMVVSPLRLGWFRHVFSTSTPPRNWPKRFWDLQGQAPTPKQHWDLGFDFGSTQTSGRNLRQQPPGQEVVCRRGNSKRKDLWQYSKVKDPQKRIKELERVKTNKNTSCNKFWTKLRIIETTV